jgi:hypothetical protein
LFPGTDFAPTLPGEHFGERTAAPRFSGALIHRCQWCLVSLETRGRHVTASRCLSVRGTPSLLSLRALAFPLACVPSCESATGASTTATCVLWSGGEEVTTVDILQSESTIRRTHSPLYSSAEPWRGREERADDCLAQAASHAIAVRNSSAPKSTPFTVQPPAARQVSQTSSKRANAESKRRCCLSVTGLGQRDSS